MNGVIKEVAEKGIVVLKNQRMTDEEFYQLNLSWGKFQIYTNHASHKNIL